MEQLSGLDAAFVHQDSHRTPMHICAVLIYDIGADDHSHLSRDTLRQMVSQRLARYPLFNSKLYQVTLGMDTPYWVDIAKPDWEKHITETAMSVGDTWQTLQRIIADVHGSRMDLTIPLWEMHLIHGLYDMPGLPKSCQALILKIHHSAIDGLSLAKIIASLHRENDTGRPRKSSYQEGSPNQWLMWTRANLNTVSRQMKLMDTIRNFVPGVIRARQSRLQFSDLPPVLSTGAQFNGRVSAARSTGAVLMPLIDVLAIKRAVRRVTINDIAISCVAGALREYLQYHNKLPTKSLASGVPISLRAARDSEASGNKLATMIVGLGTHVADPVERLRLVHRYAVAGKKQINALGTGTIMDISDSLAPGLLAEGIKSVARASRVADIPVPYHTIISNVPGPPQTLSLGTARLVTPIGFGPIRDNMGLFHIISSSETIVSLSFSACLKLLPDTEYYEHCLQAAFSDLLKSALENS